VNMIGSLFLLLLIGCQSNPKHQVHHKAVVHNGKQTEKPAETPTVPPFPVQTKTWTP
jgi:uncharacterized protein YcfL